MGTVQVKNNAYSTLASGINSVATSITVATGHGSRFPAVTTASGNYFFATLIDTANNLEIVKVTNVSSDTFTVTRGQDDTTGRAYSAGDRIELRVTAALLAELPTRAIVSTDYTAGSVGTTALAAGAVTYAKVDSASIATAAEFRAKTASNLLDTNVWDAAATVALTDAATVAVDMSTGFNFTLTLGGNRTLGQPTNTKVGQSGFIRINQDGTGSRTLAYHADWKFGGGIDPTLTTTASATDILFYQVVASNFIYATLVKAVS
jgi:hypothetical protein